MGQGATLLPFLYVMGGYFALQIVLNLVGDWFYRHGGKRAIFALKATFWCSVINALYFTIIAVLLHIWQVAPNTPPKSNYGMLALYGLPLGVALWYLTALGRKLGVALFGRGELADAEDAIVHIAAAKGSPLDARYIGWGVLNLSVIQPVGRELFLRGAFLPSVALVFGWVWAVASALLIEFLLKLNVVWALQTLVYTLVVCASFILTGSALTGLVAASLAGLIHAVALVHIAGREE